ncbi:MAG: D-aminoacyl-tRNA deacylase [Bacillota bacterium]
MRAVIQRVSRAKVTVDGEAVGSIGRGIAVLLGVGAEDEAADAAYMADKIPHLRIFENEEGKLNRSLFDIAGEALVVSQFTLYGDCRRGRRPSFSSAAPPEKARHLYELFISLLQEKGIKVATGTFQAHMLVELVNDGPVTLWLESKQ